MKPTKRQSDPLGRSRTRHRYSRYLLSLAVAITGSVWPIQARSIEPIFDSHTVLTSRKAPLGQLGANSWAPVALLVLSVNGSNFRQQPLVGDLALRWRVFAPGIVRASRNADYLAQQAHRELSLLRMHQLVRAHERSLTKKATDFLRNSNLGPLTEAVA